MITSILLNLTTFLLLIWIGLQIVTILTGSHDWEFVLGVAFPVGSGFFTFLMFIFSWLGFPINKLSVITLYIASTLLLGIYQYSRTKRFLPTINLWHPNQHVDLPGRLFSQGVWLIWGLLMVIAILVSVGRSHAATDAAGHYAIQGYGIALEKTIRAGENWGMWGLSYPQNIMLQITNLQLFGGDLLPGSKLIFPLYLISISLSLNYFYKKLKINRIIAGLSILFISSNIVVFIQSTNGLINGPFASTLTLGVISTHYGIVSGRKGEQLLGGILLGIAAWTRPEGIVYSLLIGLGFIVTNRLLKVGRVYGHFILLPIFTFGTWVAFSAGILSAHPPGAGIASVIQNYKELDWNLYELYLIPRVFIARALYPDNWGAFLPVLCGLILSALLIGKSWFTADIKYLSVITFLICLIPYGLFYLFSFNPWDPFILLLREQFDQAFLPAFMMLTILATTMWSDKTQGDKHP